MFVPKRATSGKPIQLGNELDIAVYTKSVCAKFNLNRTVIYMPVYKCFMVTGRII